MTVSQDSRRRIVSIILASAGLSALYVSIGIHYEHAASTTQGFVNGWFGADISRHIDWMLVPGAAAGAPLHPLAFLVFKVYGLVFGFFGLLSRGSCVVLFSLPVVLAVVLSLPTIAWITGDRDDPTTGSWLTGLGFLIAIGPTLLFAPIPESHTLGGVALLFQSALLLKAIRAEAVGARTDVPRFAQGVLVLGACATGFTLSNLLPAIIIISFLPRSVQRRRLALAGSGAVVLVLLYLTGVAIKHHALSSPDHLAEIRVGMQYELRFARVPSVGSVLLSWKNLVLAQFGLPAPHLVISTDGGAAVPVVRPLFRVVSIQGAAFVCWLIGVTLWLRYRRRSHQGLRRFIVASMVALLSVVAFHAVYASSEAYLFAAHAWPYIALPVSVILSSTESRRHPASLFLILALVLSAFQAATSLHLVFDLLRAV